MQQLVNSPLPPCSLSIIRDYLTSKGYHPVPEFSDEEHEFWATSDNFNTVRFPIDEDPMHYFNAVSIAEIQLGLYLGDIPFYAKQIAQRFDPEGHN